MAFFNSMHKNGCEMHEATLLSAMEMAFNERNYDEYVSVELMIYSIRIGESYSL